jgi:hypothetical protein
MNRDTQGFVDLIAEHIPEGKTLEFTQKLRRRLPADRIDLIEVFDEAEDAFREKNRQKNKPR